MARPRTTVFPLSSSEGTVQQKQPSSIFLCIFAVCLTSVVTAVHYTNYGPLIPVLRTDLHISSGQAGLMSTFLFLGLATTYIPAGVLIDRYGPRPVLIGSCILLTDRRRSTTDLSQPDMDSGMSRNRWFRHRRSICSRCQCGSQYGETRLAGTRIIRWLHTDWFRLWIAYHATVLCLGRMARLVSCLGIAGYTGSDCLVIY